MDRHQDADGMIRHYYLMLGISTAISAVVMYFSMYAMIDTFQSFYNNINQVYMVAMMTAPMVGIMLLAMRSMYTNARLNMILYIASALIFVLSFAAIRYQVAVGDRQFLRSMIPHHSGAILMCRNSRINETEIRRLCDQIIKSQQDEISQMRALLQKI